MNYHHVLERIHSEIVSLSPVGKVADYIPELAKIDPNKFGFSLSPVGGGGPVEVGDATERFSIQSIAKVLALALALAGGADEVWERVGVEPSGNPFNSLVQLEYEAGIPRNPLINPGAIVISDILISRLPSPKRDLLAFVRKISGCGTVTFNEAVATSEACCGYRNIAVANLMKSFGNIRNSVADVLDFYVHMCSLEMSCRELAHTFLYFADPIRYNRMGSDFLTDAQVKRINAVMLMCGFYDEAGEFAYGVGLPGKSGVGGGIVAVCPNEFSVAVWSPRLNRKGNSYLGTEALSRLTTLTGLSIF